VTSLTPPERRALRAKAHHLHPVVSVGQHGLTAAVLHEIDVNLIAHELIKVRVFNDDRAAREALLASICAELDAAPVQHIGKLFVVWRPSPDQGKSAPEAPARVKPPKREPRAPARQRPRKIIRSRSPDVPASAAKKAPQARRPRSPMPRAPARPPGHGQPAPKGRGMQGVAGNSRRRRERG
jgi:putative YhbY family RNA-binding protein